MPRTNYEKIIAAFPENTEAVSGLKGYADALDKTQALEKSITSEGGVMLLDYFRNETQNILNELLRNYRVAARDDLVAIIAALEQNIKVVVTIEAAKGKSKNLQDIIDTELKKIAAGRT